MKATVLQINNPFLLTSIFIIILLGRGGTFG